VATFEREIAEGDVVRASECFLTSATREVMPVRSVTLTDGREVEFPQGGGDWTRRAAHHYREYVEKYIAENAAASLFDCLASTDLSPLAPVQRALKPAGPFERAQRFLVDRENGRIRGALLHRKIERQAKRGFAQSRRAQCVLRFVLGFRHAALYFVPSI